MKPLFLILFAVLFSFCLSAADKVAEQIMQSYEDGSEKKEGTIAKLKSRAEAFKKAGDVKSSEEILAMIAELAGDKNADASQPAQELTQIEKDAMKIERDKLLKSAKDEKDPVKIADMLASASILLFNLDEKAGNREITNIVKKYGNLDYGNIAGKVLLAQGEYYAKRASTLDASKAKDAWKKAEAIYEKVWTQYKGSYGDKGCDAANIVAKHYEGLGNMDKVVELKEVVVQCGGSYGNSAGEACLWLAKYYSEKGDNAKAVMYLKKVISQYKGAYDVLVPRAEEMMKTIIGDSAEKKNK